MLQVEEDLGGHDPGLRGGGRAAPLPVRVRFTVWRMMIGVAMLAVILTIDRGLFAFLVSVHDPDMSRIKAGSAVLGLNAFVFLAVWAWRAAHYD